MISSKFLLVAENVIKDIESNSLSLINILEDITVESFPIVIQRIAIVSFLEKTSEDDDKVSIILKISNNKNVLLEHTIKADFRGKNKNRTIVKFGGILMPEPGVTKFELLSPEDRRLICEYNLNLKLREPIQVV